jgi:hypothetical protein
MRLAFDHLTMPRPSIAAVFGRIAAAVLDGVRDREEVKLWQAAAVEASEYRRAVILARAELAALDARRTALLVRGGSDVVKQLKEIDAERARRREELAEAESMVPAAAEVEAVRCKAVESLVKDERARQVSRTSQDSRKREAEIVQEIAERCGDLFSELVTVHAAGEAVAPMLFQEDRASAHELVARLEAEGIAARKAAQAKAEAKAAAAGLQLVAVAPQAGA